MNFSNFLKTFLLVLISSLMMAISFAEKEPVSSAIASTPPVLNASLPNENAAKPSLSAGRLWNLQDADILSVINEVSQETGKNFVVDPRVSGKITLISSKPIRPKEVYQVFLSVLSILGYAAIPSGNVIKIVPNMESAEQATAVLNKSSPGKGEEVVVRVIPLENVSSAQLIPVLRPLLPQWSNISSYAPGNVLILLGRAANLDRMMTIIQDVDQAAHNGIQIVPLHRASASQVATVLNNLQNAARATGETSVVSIAVDERSNSVLLGGPKAARLKMRVLISELDAPAATPAGNTEVVYLRYLEAKTFAPLLGKIAQNIIGKDKENIAINAGSTGQPAAASKESVMNSTTIQAEPNSNAVIITAPPALMQALKMVIAKLDIRPAQVLVEAIIAQIDESNLKSLGIQWGAVIPNGTIQTTIGLPTDYASLGAGVVGIIPTTQIHAVLSVLQNQNGVDILSTPQIVVLDNQKATIEVGQDVPEQTGQYSTTGTTGTVTPFNTIGRLKVTLKLEVTPQINLGSSVRLKINLKNDTLQNPQNPGINPVVNTSNISNSVIINSEDILVLGGLISNANIENINKVPILSSVPILGPLFQQKTNNQQKRNLMVFIKPVIMQNAHEAMTLSYDKYSTIRSAQANFRDELRDIGDSPLDTRLPPWKNKKDLPTPFESQAR